MPCYRCGARQVDPVRGHSPWRRAVRDDQQVLVCPGCQEGTDWAAEVDTCPRCGSVHLVRRLGEVEIHHVDLGAGYAPPDWPAPFVADQLERAAWQFAGRDDVVDEPERLGVVG